jgi:E3 ubiquitin-protein ligase FANCL
MEKINETRISEQENPIQSATACRIALGNDASINTEGDARHPLVLPECCFLGAD